MSDTATRRRWRAPSSSFWAMATRPRVRCEARRGSVPGAPADDGGRAPDRCDGGADDVRRRTFPDRRTGLNRAQSSSRRLSGPGIAGRPDPAITWAIADRFGPLLTAMFANSPTLDGVSFTLRKGTTLTKEMFLNHLYGGMDEPELKIIDVFICKLRKKLSEATGGDSHIETVWGRGYVLRDPEPVQAEQRIAVNA